MMNTHGQLAAIQSMLVAGHRSVRLDTHTLLLWGLGGGGLVAFTDPVISAAQFPEVSKRAVAVLIWLIFWGALIAGADYLLTRRARAKRNEPLPFAQAQISRAWWMLLVMGALGTFAMFFFGGGTMTYSMWTVLLGLGIYFFGLFSRPLIEWIGIATLLLGVAGLAAGIPFPLTHWLAASCFAIGLPLAGWLLHRVDDHLLPRRLMALGIWLAAVLAPPLVSARLGSPPPAPALPCLSLEAFQAEVAARGLPSGQVILTLPAGTQVPLRLMMSSELVSVPPQAGLHVQLNQPLEIVLDQGQPEGLYRIGQGQWHRVRDGILFLNISKLEPRFDGATPYIHSVAELNLHGDKP